METPITMGGKLSNSFDFSSEPPTCTGRNNTKLLIPNTNPNAASLLFDGSMALP